MVVMGDGIQRLELATEFDEIAVTIIPIVETLEVVDDLVEV